MRRLSVVCTAVSVVLAVLAIPPRPALGDHGPAPESHNGAGSGNLQGTELVEDQAGAPCFRVTRHLFGLRGAGTYEGRTTAGDPVVYRAQIAEGETLHSHGPLWIQIENTEPYYHSPLGTHGTETGGGAGCSPSTTAAPIPAEFRVFAAEGVEDTDADSDVDLLTGAAWVYRLEGADKVPCRAQGTFARGNKDNPAINSDKWVAEWTLGEDCVVVGNDGTAGAGSAPRGTFHTHHGEHEPCFGGPCYSNIQVDYAQYLPKPGPVLTLSGPATATIGCEPPPTVVARLVVDGVPESDATVNFSVAGPAPAAPPAGVAITGSDGRASFTFAAALAGDYAVTAAATYDGVERAATRTVRFVDPPPAGVTVAGPATGQTEETVTVTATVRDACAAVPGAVVDFAVAWPTQAKPWTGQATPSTGTAVTGADGQATFSFTGDRAGDYAVTASTSIAGDEATGTHVVRVDILNMKRIGNLELGDEAIEATLMDPTGRYAYYLKRRVGLFGKVDLATFQLVGEIPTRTRSGAAVIDPAGRHAYVVARDTFVKIDLVALEVAGTTAIEASNGDDFGAVSVVDPAGEFAYIGLPGALVDGVSGAGVVKVDLNTFQRVGAIHFADNEAPRVAVVDPRGRFAYFGTERRLNKVDLTSFTQVGSIGFQHDDGRSWSALIDPTGDHAYIGTNRLVVKIDLRASRRVGSLDIGGLDGGPLERLTTALMDPGGRFAYFGKYCCGAAEGVSNVSRLVPTPERLVKIDLRTFDRAHAITLEDNWLTSAVTDPAGDHAYIGSGETSSSDGSARIVKVQLKRPPNPVLVADDDAYATDYATPLTVAAPGVLDGDADTDGDPLVAGQVTDPANGSVDLNPNGSFTYTPNPAFAGTDTFTYTASDGMEYSTAATVSITVESPQGLTGSAYGYHTNVSLFGGPYEPRGPAPTVELAPDGSNSPQDAHLNEAEAVYGPATLFRSGAIDVHTEGVLATVPQVKASASVQGHPDPAQRPGPLLYDGLAANCSATPSDRSASVSVTNGVVETKYDPDTQEAIEFHPVPVHPPPGYTVEGTIDHVGDRFRIVFNEQVQSPDGSITVSGAHIHLLGPTAVGDLFIAQSACGVPSPTGLPPVADFDGDADTDISVFRPSSGAWHVQGQPTTYHGRSGDAAVPADYDADAEADMAVFRPQSGGWFVQGRPTVYHGRSGDIAVPADYNGDGTADLAVFRPQSGGWYVEGQAPVFFGRHGDIPVPGHYDADAAIDLAVFRPANGAWLVQDSPPVYFGRKGDVPVPADYDGDGDTDIAVFRPASGGWHRPGQATVFFGANGDVPVPGDYAGDASADIAVFRPASGGWHRPGQATVFFGRSGDVPLPLPHAIHQVLFS